LIPDTAGRRDQASQEDYFFMEVNSKLSGIKSRNKRNSRIEAEEQSRRAGYHSGVQAFSPDRLIA
jgi:hypothetical protein